MSAAEVLAVIRALQATVAVAQNAGVHVRELVSFLEDKRARGEEPTDAELQEFIDSAQAAIDRI